MEEGFDPLRSMQNLLKKWWQIVLFGLLAALIGLGISYLLTPMYQAEAIFYASIDFRDINFENLVTHTGEPYEFTQYDEDLALEAVRVILLEVMPAAQQYALSLDPNIDQATFQNDMQIERNHAQWFLRFRHPDPQIAQQIVGYWAQMGLDALKMAQTKERIEPYVMVDLVSSPGLPQTPIYRHRGVLVLAGGLIGLVAGIIFVDFRGRYLLDVSKGEL